MKSNSTNETYPLTHNQRMMLPPALRSTATAMALVSLYGIAALFALPAIFMIPAHTLFVTGMVHLLGIGYGIINDLFAVNRNLAYFTFGHNPGQQDGVINSDNKAANAFAWGQVATFAISIPFAIIFGITTLVCDIIGLPFASFILPTMAVGMLVAGIGAEIFSRITMKKRMKAGKDQWTAAWYSNSDRNSFGYAVLPLLGVGALISYITLRAVHIATPALFVSFGASFMVQFSLVALPLALLAVGMIHLRAHYNERTYASGLTDFPSWIPGPEDGRAYYEYLDAEKRAARDATKSKLESRADVKSLVEHQAERDTGSPDPLGDDVINDYNNGEGTALSSNSM